MALADTEFFTRIDNQLCNRVLATCGEDGLYPAPDYLIIQSAEAGFVVPQFEVREDADLPIFVAQYIFSEPAAFNTGMSGDERLHHIWNLGVFFPLSREIMGLTEATPYEFRLEVLAAGRLLQERVRLALNLFAPDVTDTTFAGQAHSTDNGRVTIIRPWFQRQDEHAYTMMLFYEWTLNSEILS